MKKTKLKIGIYDDLYFSLQSRLLQEGHELLVYVGAINIPPSCFNVTDIKTKNIKQAKSFSDLIDANCDLYIVGTDLEHQAYDILKMLGKKVIGHSEVVCALEYDRHLAHTVLKSIDCEGKYKLKLPQQHEFNTKEEAISFLDETEKSWVVKQSSASPLHVTNNRTVVSWYPHHRQVIGLIEAPINAWFNEKDQGGIIFEEYISGHEVSYGWWFDGEKFVGDMYACEEHKGAQNNDRGRLLTGEVGSWLKFYKKPVGMIANVMQSLTSLLRGKCNGMIDINTRITDDGEVYFLEFTNRFGRPTLETMMAALRDTKDFSLGQSFLAIAAGDSSSIDNWYKYNTTVSITVFSYGIPVLKDNYIGTIPFTAPATVKDISSFQQLFCKYDHKTKCWSAAPNDRHFVVVGLSNNDTPQARQHAYAVLKDFDLLGCTWRDDVGSRSEVILKKIEGGNVINNGA